MTGSLSVTTAHSMTMKFHRNAEMTTESSFVKCSELAVEVMDADFRMHNTQSESLGTRLILSLICENEC